MIPANDMAQRSEEISSLFAAYEIGQGIKRLIDLARDFDDGDSRNEAVVISASYHRLEKQEREGIIDSDRAKKDLREILFQALGLIDAIQQRLMH